MAEAGDEQRRKRVRVPRERRARTHKEKQKTEEDVQKEGERGEERGGVDFAGETVLSSIEKKKNLSIATEPSSVVIAPWEYVALGASVSFEACR